MTSEDSMIKQTASDIDMVKFSVENFAKMLRLNIEYAAVLEPAASTLDQAANALDQALRLLPKVNGDV